METRYAVVLSKIAGATLGAARELAPDRCDGHHEMVDLKKAPLRAGMA